MSKSLLSQNQIVFCLLFFIFLAVRSQVYKTCFYNKSKALVQVKGTRRKFLVHIFLLSRFAIALWRRVLDTHQHIGCFVAPGYQPTPVSPDERPTQMIRRCLEYIIRILLIGKVLYLKKNFCAVSLQIVMSLRKQYSSIRK